ncbi:neuropeptide CCHamide-1 receptor-like [Mercenaria mercenaria]|uniref:neuropeptide CCHamide-1 receptor-like n=1 Tax=Mercenaria mercenaria TaxID=6596 RepID=UPI00234F264F|nr:neuropeptide CCHamide-1 receptor-like [Mercenaria mercenaria]XP_045197919.2 neuropeptide CCHamide-1 receptor-like [Mercenaria mercenaria]
MSSENMSTTTFLSNISYTEQTTDLNNSTAVMQSTENTTVVEPLIEAEERPEAVIVPILFAIIFLVGVIGNTALIFTVLRNKSMRNTPNIFVVSLSIGDLLLLLCSVPFSSTFYSVTSWPFGEGLCKFNEFMQTLSLGVSIFTLTALSGDRYIAIVHPMSKHTGKPTLITVVTVVGIWTLSMVLAVPDGYTSKLEYVSGFLGENSTNSSSTDIHLGICMIYPLNYPDWYQKVHSMTRFIVFFVIPLLIIGLFYILMARILILSSRDMPCESMKDSAMNQQQKRQVQARLKVAKVVLSFVIIFIICWLPRHISILIHFHSDVEYNMFWHVFKIISFCLTYIYSCVNPYALYFLSSQFRKYYNRYLFCCCPKFKYRSLGAEQSAMYNFNSTVRRGSTTYTGVVHSQSMC